MNDSDTKYPLPAIDAGIVSEKDSNPVREKSFRFALMIVGLCRELQADREFVISKQLMRSGTGIGANVEEAVSAESRKDFLHKLNIALKEAREAYYWLRLLDASEIEIKRDLRKYVADANELIRLLVSITRKLSQK
ncbi:MAG: four helix bundle protein [Acidobacteriota bacterium]|nr:four helix bundle protein [Acidobacteriota bacterium]